MIKNIFIILLLIFSKFTFALSNIERGTKFIVLGHLYPIIDDEKKMYELANKVNSYNPDYIFILGGSKLYDDSSVKKIKKLFQSKLYFSPGNEEFLKKKDYVKNIGYLNKLIEEKDVRFILFDSNESIQNIIKVLKNFLKNDFKNGPTILLTHHRIWDDTLIRKDHDKNFYFEDLYPHIKNKVNFVFAGNGKRQYFRDLEDNLIYGKQNVNVIFWLDKVGEINNYAIGMGDGHPKAIFTIASVINRDLLIKGDYSTTAEYEILPKELISKDKHKLSTKYTGGNYFFINKKKFYIVLIIVLIFFLGGFVLKKNKK